MHTILFGGRARTCHPYILLVRVQVRSAELEEGEPQAPYVAPRPFKVHHFPAVVALDHHLLQCEAWGRDIRDNTLLDCVCERVWYRVVRAINYTINQQ